MYALGSSTPVIMVDGVVSDLSYLISVNLSSTGREHVTLRLQSLSV